MNGLGEPNMGNPSVRFDEGRSGARGTDNYGRFKPSCLLRLLYMVKGCASEAGWNAGESPACRIRLFTAEHDLNSAARRRAAKLRKMNRWAVTTVNHI
jgi:hypothetical protein